MPDKVSELWDLGNGAAVRLHGRVNKVYPTQTGEGQYGPWYRTDLDFEDDTGKVKIGFFHNNHPECPLQLQGATVKVEGQVKTYRKRDNTQGLGVTGKSVELADVQGGSAHPPPQQGGAPQQPRQQTAPPSQGTMTDVDYLHWLAAMEDWITSNLPMIGKDPQAAQAACATAWIASGRGELTLTLGRQAAPERGAAQSAYDRARRAGHLSTTSGGYDPEGGYDDGGSLNDRAEEKTFESNPGNFTGTHSGRSSAQPEGRRYEVNPEGGGGYGDDDEGIPFSIILIPMILPLLGALVGLS